MKFSFVIPYRNRDLERVSRCVQSIHNQTNKDFEIVFIDYGSEPAIQQEIEHLCRNYSCLRYTYWNTRGWLWSRSHAINLGIEQAQGDYLIVVDIDLIYPPHFVGFLEDKVDENSFFQYRCYYLPENFPDYGKLDFHRAYSFKVSDGSGNGLLVVPKKKIQQIGGFDNQFKVWGFEDIDIHKRLLRAGMQLRWLEINEVPTFHQWHPSSVQIDLMPESWLAMMRAYWESKSEVPNATQAPHRLHNIAERPALQMLKHNGQMAKYAEVFTFTYPLVKSYVLFFQKFHALQSHQSLVVVQSFEEIQAGEGAKLGSFFKKVNRVLEKMKISYRMTELLTYQTELITFYAVRDFLYYFVNHHSHHIEDYYLNNENQKKLTFVVVKK